MQKFPFILDEIATEGGKTFAIVIDEAHSEPGRQDLGGDEPGARRSAGAEDEDADPTLRTR